MRKIILISNIFKIPLILVVISMFFLTAHFPCLRSIQEAIIASILGTGIAIFSAESFRRLQEHKRLKKTFGILKLVYIPYLQNVAENIQDSLVRFNDICDISRAFIFAVHVSKFGEISASIDKNFLGMIFDQNFLDTIDTDAKFNKVSTAIFELLIFIKKLTFESTNASIDTMNNIVNLPLDEQSKFVERMRQKRDDLKNSVDKFKKYIDVLDQEMVAHLQDNGAKYTEVNR